jgi:hypothetical protein
MARDTPRFIEHVLLQYQSQTGASQRRRPAMQCLEGKLLGQRRLLYLSQRGLSPIQGLHYLQQFVLAGHGQQAD